MTEHNSPRELYVDRAQLDALLSVDPGDHYGEEALAAAGLRFGVVAARRTHDPALLPKVARALRFGEEYSDDPFTAYVICEAITAIVKRQAGLDPAILALARDRRPALRAAVAAGLTSFDPACRELLLEMLHDRHGRVRGAARASLRSWADAVPWWTGLVTTDPEQVLDAAGVERLRALDARLLRARSLDDEDRAALATLPRAVVLEVLEGLLVAAGDEAIGEEVLVATALETPGGIDLLCRLWSGQPSEVLEEWGSWTRSALARVAPQRQALVAFRLARRALSLPRVPRPDLPPGYTTDLAGLFAAWVAEGWPEDARPSRLLALLAHVPVAESHDDVRAKVARALERTAAPHAGALGERMLRALVEADEALLAQLGGRSIVERLAELAPPELRRRRALETLDAADPEARVGALDALVREGLGTDEDVPRLRAALERGVREHPDLHGRFTEHLIPYLRARLRGGELTESEAAGLLRAINARAGGVWLVREHEAPTRPLDVGAEPGAPIGPPTPEEWAAYRTARASIWRAEGPRAGVTFWLAWGVLPAGPWDDDDWQVLDAVVRAIETRAMESLAHAAEQVATVLRLEASPRAGAMLRRLRDLGLGAPEDHDVPGAVEEQVAVEEDDDPW